MATLTAGDVFGAYQGYYSAFAVGSLSPATFGGFTCVVMITGATAGAIDVVFGGDARSYLTGKSITVEGVAYDLSGAISYDSGNDQTSASYTYGPGNFTVGNSYSVDFADSGASFTGPTYIGKSTASGGTGAISVSFASSGRASGDKLFLIVETANQAVTAPSGWTEIANSPQFRGTAGITGGVRITVFEKTSDGTEGTVNIADAGDHQYAVGVVFRSTDGVEIDAGSGNNQAASTSGVFGGVTTTGADRLIVHFVVTDRDSTLAAWSAETNANLANITEQHDASSSAGSGGGIAVITGEKATAGATGNTTATQAAGAAYCWITLALKNASGGGPATYDETLTETGTAAQSATTAATFQSAATEAATAAASQAGGLAQSASLNEAAMSGAAQTAAIVHAPALSEGLSADEASATTAQFVSALSEAGTSAASPATTATFGAAVEEAGAANDSPTASATWAAARAELVAANDDAGSGLIAASDLAEGGIVGASEAAALDMASALVSDASADATPTSSAQFDAGLSEAATASEESVGSVVGGASVYDVSLAEDATVAAAQSQVATLHAARAEVASGAAQQSAVATMSAARTESASATDVGVGRLSIGAAISETASLAAAQAIAAVLSVAVAEAIAANDDGASLADASEAIEEIATASVDHVIEGGERVPVPAERRAEVQAEIRSVAVPAETRTAAVASETRIASVVAESRAVAVPGEDRSAAVAMAKRVAA